MFAIAECAVGIAPLVAGIAFVRLDEEEREPRSSSSLPFDLAGHWLWARVVGDALDVAMVSTGFLTQRRPLRTLATVGMRLGIAYVDTRLAEAAPPDKKREKRTSRDYSARSGFPRPIEAMRGIALRPSSKMAWPAEEVRVTSETARETSPS